VVTVATLAHLLVARFDTTPTAADFARLEREVAAGHERAGRPLVILSILPEGLSRPPGAEAAAARGRFEAEAARHAERAYLVVPGRGLVHRLVVAAVRAGGGGQTILGSLDAAAEALAGLGFARAELEALLATCR
jgi:hypothetical protein